MHTVEQIKEYNIKTVLDYGSGTGVYAESYRLQGYDAYAYEIWYAHRKYIRENAPHLKIVEQPITTDLLHFIETAEHMTDEELNNLFAIINPTYILFSSTSQRTDWDAAWGHINIKTQDEWIRYFNDIGYSMIRELRLPTHYTKLFRYERN
jgi:predicted RNA methylase